MNVVRCEPFVYPEASTTGLYEFTHSFKQIIAVGREQLTAERQTIIRELRGTVGTLAVDLASRIVGESLQDEARRKGTVDRFLADLDAAPNGGRS